MRRAIIGACVALACGGASAQQFGKSICMTTGAAGFEPVPGQQGQTLQASTYTCRIEGGPLDGAVTTGTNLYHYDKAVGTLIAGYGVQRREGQIAAAFSVIDGKLILKMVDGKIAGWEATGKGRFAVGVGAASEFAGKSYTYTARSTGVIGHFTIESRFD